MRSEGKRPNSATLECAVPRSEEVRGHADERICRLVLFVGYIKNQLLLAFLLSIITSVSAADLPKRKSGLWEITMTLMPNPLPAQKTVWRECVDQASDDRWMRPMDLPGCPAASIKEEKSQISLERICKLDGRVVIGRTVATGDFISEYTIDSSSTIDPPYGDYKESYSRITAKWIGPCGPGQRHGDTINIK